MIGTCTIFFNQNPHVKKNGCNVHLDYVHSFSKCLGGNHHNGWPPTLVNNLRNVVTSMLVFALKLAFEGKIAGLLEN